MYEYPMPGPESDYRPCDVLNEWGKDGIRRVSVDRTRCPFQDENWHQSNVYCPYGFWGLKHFIEQPPNKLFQKNGNWVLRDTPKEIPAGATIALAVTATQDPQLQDALHAHLRRLALRRPLTILPSTGMPASDVKQVLAALQMPAIAYFFVHGDTDQQPYLSIGPRLAGNDRDDITTYRIYPTTVAGWAETRLPPNLDGWSKSSPLVFINGCHTCELKPEEMLNFVSAFTEAEASGIIGTEISIQAPLAVEVAELLLPAIAQQRRVVEAMHDMRWALVNKGNLLGLAYTLYALADLHVTVSDG
jgi:hypothetical protein